MNIYNKMRLKILFSLLLLCSLHVNGQTTKSFSSEPTQWFKDVKEFLVASNKKDANDLMDKFEPVWLQGKLSPSQQSLVTDVSNAMLRKRLRPFPEFRDYINALIGFTTSGQSNEAFIKWHQSLDKMLAGKTRLFSDYIETCSGLFASNTFYESSSARWRSNSSTYIFEYDSMPAITFENTDLVCYSKGDSSVIYGIKGIYYPLVKRFIGTGGKVYWTRAGFSPDDVYAELRQTNIDVTGADFTSDSVAFYNKKYFKSLLTGRVTDKILANVKPETASYPRFDSYTLTLDIKELIKDADYRGGFSMHGNKMIGSGTKDQKASLIFKRNNKPFLTASARSFVIRPDRINADNTAILIKFDKDSIAHPGLRFKYINKDRQLSLLRNSESGIQMPFFNSFHQMDLMVDAIYWKIDDPIMEFRMVSGAGESKMIMESVSLYSDFRYEKLQGMSEVNPLYMLKQYAERNSRTIYIPDLAKYLKVNETNARSLIFYLSEKGFVNFDSETDEAVLNDKLYYYLSARNNKTDYDKLEIASVIDAIPNAKLNLLNFDLDLQGVSRVMMSDSQSVYIVPLDQQIKLKKDRNMEFSGRVHAGKTDFFGKKFNFDYQRFLFNMENIDSIRLKVESGELDDNGKPKLVPLKSTLQNVSGTLYIDSADNKSGRKNFPKYPVFVSEKPSYVYYDHPSIYDGVYERDRFYFKIDPFTIDSLDNFAKSGVAFEGEFNPAGIFAPSREVVVVRPDFSFGFEKETPPEGLSAYGGKGRFFDHLDLSYQGFKGKGHIDYLSSTTHASEFVFFPDSTTSEKAEFELKAENVAGVAFPQASGHEVSISWQPSKDRMLVNKINNNITLYNKKVDLDGNLVLANKGVGGNGKALYSESELISSNFYFNPQIYGADTADFNLQSDDKSAMAISTKNVRAKIDMEGRYGDFLSNGTGSYVSFPLNQYVCFIAQFKWFMDKKEVEFTDDPANAKLNIQGSDFLSVNPYQDSLRWNAGVARYSLIDYLIKARKVKQILVADAAIMPDDTATIIIEKNAVMRPLINATIIANTSSKHHVIQQSNITITGRKNYSGTGKYAYTDQAGVNHLIALERIGIDTSQQTYANGVIADSLNFQLSTNIQYKGKVYIQASNPLLNFSGFARVNHNCTEELKVDWFSFSGDIDAKGVNIPVNKPENETRRKLAVGISVSTDSLGFYPSFFTQKRTETDSSLITAEGFLAYNAKGNIYKVASVEKLNSPDEAGNSVALDNAKCTVTGEGKLDLGVNFGQFKLMSYGTVVYNTNNDSVEFDMLLGFDFMFSDDAVKSFAEVIENYPTLPPTKDGRPVWIRSMRSIIGREAAEKITTEYNLYGAPKKVPAQLQQTFFLTDVKMYWDKSSQSYKSRGQIGVGFAGKAAISRLLLGYVEITRKRGGDGFNFYLEADKNNWWYFNYSRGIMQAISSDTKFNDAIQNLKPDKRVADTKDNKPPYEYMLSTDRKRAEFVKKMKGQ
jgi:hypothetical protein